MPVPSWVLVVAVLMAIPIALVITALLPWICFRWRTRKQSFVDLPDRDDTMLGSGGRG